MRQCKRRGRRGSHGKASALITTIARDDVRRLLEAGATLVEVLPEREYSEEHIPGAINIPLTKLTSDAASALAPDHAIIVYCWDHQ